MKIALTPVDTLFFRDSTPFDMGTTAQDGVAGVFPPNPPTVAGAVVRGGTVVGRVARRGVAHLRQVHLGQVGHAEGVQVVGEVRQVRGAQVAVEHELPALFELRRHHLPRPLAQELVGEALRPQRDGPDLVERVTQTWTQLLARAHHVSLARSL